MAIGPPPRERGESGAAQGCRWAARRHAAGPTGASLHVAPQWSAAALLACVFVWPSTSSLAAGAPVCATGYWLQGNRSHPPPTCITNNSAVRQIAAESNATCILHQFNLANNANITAGLPLGTEPVRGARLRLLLLLSLLQPAAVPAAPAAPADAPPSPHGRPAVPAAAAGERAPVETLSARRLCDERRRRQAAAELRLLLRLLRLVLADGGDHRRRHGLRQVLQLPEEAALRTVPQARAERGRRSQRVGHDPGAGHLRAVPAAGRAVVLRQGAGRGALQEAVQGDRARVRPVLYLR